MEPFQSGSISANIWSKKKFTIMNINREKKEEKKAAKNVKTRQIEQIMKKKVVFYMFVSDSNGKKKV